MLLKTRATIISTLSTIGFFGIFSTTMSKSPVLPLFARSLHSSDAVIGLIAAISPLAGILFSFPVGLLADRLGKKRLLLAAAAIFATAPLLYLLVNDAIWLVPIRFFHGVGTAILGPVSAALILGEYRESKGEKLGIYSSATLVGRSLAPLCGGAIISVVGSTFGSTFGAWNFRLVYVAAFLFSIPALILVLSLPDDRWADSGLKKIGLPDFGRSLAAFLGNRRLSGTALVEMATYFTYGAFETYLPLYLQSRGLPSYQIGLLFSLQILAIALSKPLFGKLSDRIDRRIQILVGIVALGLSFALIPVVSGLVSATAVGIAFGLALSLSTVATGSYVADVAAEADLGSSLGALSSIMDIGHSSGPFIIGVIIQSTTMGVGFLAATAVCAVCAGLFAVLTRSKGSVRPILH